MPRARSRPAPGQCGPAAPDGLAGLDLRHHHRCRRGRAAGLRARSRWWPTRAPRSPPPAWSALQLPAGLVVGSSPLGVFPDPDPDLAGTGNLPPVLDDGPAGGVLAAGLPADGGPTHRRPVLGRAQRRRRGPDADGGSRVRGHRHRPAQPGTGPGEPVGGRAQPRPAGGGDGWLGQLAAGGDLRRGRPRRPGVRARRGRRDGVVRRHRARTRLRLRAAHPGPDLPVRRRIGGQRRPQGHRHHHHRRPG